MPASLSLEAIGDDTVQMMRFWRRLLNDGQAGLGDEAIGRWPNRYWVAEITGTHPRYKYERRFLSGKKDYANANSVGSRGVRVWFVLKEGKLYEIKSPVSWHRSERYFATVREGLVVQLTDDEAGAMVAAMEGPCQASDR